MSSWFGHVAAAACVLPEDERRRWPLVSGVVALSVLPDVLDLVCSVDARRWPHSLLSCWVSALAVWGAVRLSGGHAPGRALRAAGVLVLAASTHLALDLLAGVNSYGLLWPLSSWRLKLPAGLLPSSPRPSLTNVYFYRNLALEALVFGPLVLWRWGRARRGWALGLGAVALLVGVGVSLGLSRPP